jgi:predicted GTPase
VSQLLEDVRALVGEARAVMGDGAAGAALQQIAARLDEPLRVAFAGRVKAGKSTLLNALVGEELAPTDAGECTRIVTWYQNGHTYRVTMRLRDGTEQQARFSRADGALTVDLDGHTPEGIDRLDVLWPSKRLAGVTLIDTPGLGSATAGASQPAHRFLAIGDDDAHPAEADAVIYLMRHLHQADLGFLEAFHDDALGDASPVNTIAVLSRADEVGACRPEAMQTARRIAVRNRADPRLRRLCQTVLPVSGLVAQAAMTLTEAEFRALRLLAEMPRAEVDELLLTVDRFVGDHLPAPVTPIEREDLLARLGLYGVRTSIRLIRLGAASSATELANQLRDLSGIEDLRQLLATLFTQRREVLKARAALAALEALVREHPAPETERLSAELERIVASAHELTELQVVSALRSGQIPLLPDEYAEAERLLDEPGLSIAERLGAEPGGERAAILAAVERWRARAEHPLSSRPTVEAARALARTLEGLLVQLDRQPAAG